MTICVNCGEKQKTVSATVADIQLIWKSYAMRLLNIILALEKSIMGKYMLWV